MHEQSGFIKQINPVRKISIKLIEGLVPNNALTYNAKSGRSPMMLEVQSMAGTLNNTYLALSFTALSAKTLPSISKRMTTVSIIQNSRIVLLQQRLKTMPSKPKATLSTQANCSSMSQKMPTTMKA